MTATIATTGTSGAVTTRTSGETVKETLARYAGRTVFFEPLDGNHGDRLILEGAERCMSDAGFRRVQRPDDAELIIINGGGGRFVQPWCGDMSIVRQYSVGFPDTPLVVLPSSYWWGNADLHGCFTGRQAPTTLFARERLSHQRLLAAGLPDTVTVGLDHDMAFHLPGTPLLENAKSVKSEGYVLIVERFDEEHATGQRSAIKPLFKYGRLLPRPLQRLAKLILDRARFARSEFRHVSLEQALRLEPSLAGKLTVYKDVSNVDRFTFEEFVRGIAAADAVITTRMHAGILASLLGKTMFFVPRANEYQKLQSVYAYSLAGRNKAYLLDPVQ